MLYSRACCFSSKGSLGYSAKQCNPFFCGTAAFRFEAVVTATVVTVREGSHIECTL